jgi:hypothetical protein
MSTIFHFDFVSLYSLMASFAFFPTMAAAAKTPLQFVPFVNRSKQESLRYTPEARKMVPQHPSQGMRKKT